MRWRLVWEAATHSRSLASLSDKALIFLNLDRRRPSLSALGKTSSCNDVFIIL